MLDSDTEWKEELEGTQYDLRQSRLDILGRLVQEKTVAYLKLRKEATPGNLKSYLDVLVTFYRNIKFYGGEDTEEIQDKIEDKVSRLETRVHNMMEEGDVSQRRVRKTRGKLEDVDDLIDELRIEAGLDIPREKSKPEGMEMMK